MDKPLVAIVDDAPEIVSLMEEVLGDAGYRAVAGESGDAVEERLARELPGLVILDIRLPGTATGLPLLRAICDNPATAHLPILVATADATFLREHAGALKNLGCETLAKPFDIESLLECVASLLPVGGHRQP